ncbi:molybdopterin-dependent oxidoreductase [Candidatus Nitrospira allomarina]|jgi:DMSO/TMAO reductase YedYZ molybdopterin-dependent catalytic subunit|uniref:Molybdopterin-dependent oxidoreductase n=1 Tax=Candidatus Nitrospira allomarina TaxID=3020900 RepID=A0AA96GAF5_9BACT|nr:molybdopterin-dependent oxidoreductase [Candidatus Nitrospira allomarina]WNM57427.1 molybdopterin-dependent oxidoreductase [Candidatus Nitrospira allomarina]
MSSLNNSPFSFPLSRRALFKLGGLATIGVGFPGCDLGSMFAVPPRETTYFTSNEKFYTVNFMDASYNFTRDLDVEQWKMVVKGAVERPLVMKWRDLLNQESFDQAVTLMCIDTLPGGSSLGTAMWRGISLKKLLQDIGADEDTARDVIFRASDGYSDSIPFARAMEDDVMLAYLMNGEKLPKDHGFPVRLIVPGLYGIKNVKWITEIEVYNGDYLGYWQQKGWTDDGTIHIFSRIDSPGHYQSLQGSQQRLRGIAYGGPESISEVQLSFDQEKTWVSAEIEPPLSPLTWVIWNYDWSPPKPGKHMVSVRAIDTKGKIQTSEITRPQPAGATGLHSIVLDVLNA